MLHLFIFAAFLRLYDFFLPPRPTPTPKVFYPATPTVVGVAIGGAPTVSLVLLQLLLCATVGVLSGFFLITRRLPHSSRKSLTSPKDLAKCDSQECPRWCSPPPAMSATTTENKELEVVIQTFGIVACLMVHIYILVRSHDHLLSRTSSVDFPSRANPALESTSTHPSEIVQHHMVYPTSVLRREGNIPSQFAPLFHSECVFLLDSLRFLILGF